MIGEIVDDLAKSIDRRQDLEKELQLALNCGEVATAKELEQLHSRGYSISYAPDTIARFASFTFPDDEDYTKAVQSATEKGGLLVDGDKMYLPGPVSAIAFKGAAKGYDEIYAIFEEQTTEKTRIGKDTSHIIDLISQNLPFDHSWKNNITLLDLSC